MTISKTFIESKKLSTRDKEEDTEHAVMQEIATKKSNEKKGLIRLFQNTETSDTLTRAKLLVRLRLINFLFSCVRGRVYIYRQNHVKFPIEIINSKLQGFNQWSLIKVEPQAQVQTPTPAQGKNEEEEKQEETGDNN